MPEAPSPHDAVCPEPLRGLVGTTPPGPASLALLERLQAAEAPAAHGLGRGDLPIVWTSAAGALVWDADGNRYLDFCAGFGAAALGHAHPRVVAAAKDQIDRWCTASATSIRTRRASRSPRAEALAPFADARVVFASRARGRARAQDHAAGHRQARRARVHGGLPRRELGRARVSGWERFRGRSWAGATPRSGARAGRPTGVLRCDLGLSYPACGLACVREAGRVLEAAEKRLGGVGAVLVEPVMGRGGDHVPPPEWLPGIAELARRAGALLVADEVLTGFGRTGALWAAEAAGVVPDLVCCGKALGGGFPLAAVLMRPDAAAAWQSAAPVSGETLHAATFYAHPVACAAALAALAVLEDEDWSRAPRRSAGLHEAWPSSPPPIPTSCARCAAKACWPGSCSTPRTAWSTSPRRAWPRG
jgi:4-aminobutyrate aminotransferase-like enzyme